ncbi:MAG: glycoside hydrolase family 28 protein [Spirochaetaceae bacterium]|nr:glycoside hydrolase family 28 protein [Spirochaetaceae bacterium]
MARNDEASGTSVRRFGASGDGEAKDGPAIQAAIDAVSRSGGGDVVLPPGGYASGSLFLKDGVRLRLEQGATLLGSRDVRDYPVVDSRWEGSTRSTHAALIHARGAIGIGIVGPGTIDGRGQEWWRLFEEKALERPRPRLVALEDCEGVVLSGFSAKDSPSWTINPVRCRDVLVSGLSIRNPPDSPNTDGINPDSCSSVRIIGCFVSVGDDCITIKAGTEDEKPGLRRPCEDIVVADCVLERGHGGVVIGSEMSGGVRNVVVSNCVLKGTDRGIRMKSRRGRGGSVERVRVSNIVMDDVLCPFTMNLRYACGSWGNPLVADRGPRPAGEGTPTFRDISFNGITATNVRLAAAWLDGLPERPIEGVSFFDVSVGMGGSDAPAPVEMSDDAGAEARAGFIAFNVRGLRLGSFRISGHEGEAWRLSGCEGAERWGCSPA